MLRHFYRNHVVANLLFGLVLVMGLISYQQMPREQDPLINFNWILITTVLPGAAALDVEARITEPLEDAIARVGDIKFVSSNSRESVSSILIRFEQLDEREFDRRLADLRREIQAAEDELPPAAEDPFIFEVTSANAWPTATLALVGEADDLQLRYAASAVEKDLERLPGVDRVEPRGLDDAELQLRFDPRRLAAAGVSPVQLADSVASYYRDLAAGSLDVGGDRWLGRLAGTTADPEVLARLPVLGARGPVPLGELARLESALARSSDDARVGGRPAVELAVLKDAEANVLTLMGRLKDYVAEYNRGSVVNGLSLVLIDDQTVPTRRAISVMQNNALIGLLFVLGVTFLFLGGRIAVLVTIGIPFILAGSLWLLHSFGHTLNVTLLLGIVIALGMLVDDAVVIVEAIHDRLQSSLRGLDAALAGLREVAAPVLTSVLTTIAAFLPLMLLPGILGEFMRVIPIVVAVALAVSLVEAYWMLPVHVAGWHLDPERPGRLQRLRERGIRRLRLRYVQTLIWVLRRPRRVLGGLVLLLLLAATAASSDLIRKDFFAADSLRKFYVNVWMPPRTSLEETMAKVLEVEEKVRAGLQDGELRAMISYAGRVDTETEPLFGDWYGQILVGLHPPLADGRNVDAIIDGMRGAVQATPGPEEISFLRLAGGPPTSSAINVKLRGDDYARLSAASAELKAALAAIPGVRDIRDDAVSGRDELVLGWDAEALRRSGLDPLSAARTLRLFGDGEVVAQTHHRGDELAVRVLAERLDLARLDDFLAYPIALPVGGQIALGEAFVHQVQPGLGNIRHYNFRRAITVEADIDPARTDAVAANAALAAAWAEMAPRYPALSLDVTGELDDINESLDAIAALFLLGLGLMYLITGTQFRSYFQPLMILASVPLAFTGVVLGLLINRDPLSLYTLYGVVALAGIAVNAAIVLISAANERLARGMSLEHAVIYAARRRVVPILITTFTTIAGLFSLAAGLGGKSLIWGPVATAIVWGLAFSSLLTLLVVPLLYRLSMGRSPRLRRHHGGGGAAG